MVRVIRNPFALFLTGATLIATALWIKDSVFAAIAFMGVMFIGLAIALALFKIIND